MKFLVSAVLIAFLTGCTSFPAAVLPDVANAVPKEISNQGSKSGRFLTKNQIILQLLKLTGRAMYQS